MRSAATLRRRYPAPRSTGGFSDGLAKGVGCGCGALLIVLALLGAIVFLPVFIGGAS